MSKYSIDLISNNILKAEKQNSLGWKHLFNLYINITALHSLTENWDMKHWNALLYLGHCTCNWKYHYKDNIPPTILATSYIISGH